jgi:DNA-3-methyladenine glycosylase II
MYSNAFTRRGCAAFIGKDVNKLKAKGGKFKYMSEKDMLELAEKFRPYRYVFHPSTRKSMEDKHIDKLSNHRTLFMWYMWKVEDVDVTVMN